MRDRITFTALLADERLDGRQSKESVQRSAMGTYRAASGAKCNPCVHLRVRALHDVCTEAQEWAAIMSCCPFQMRYASWGMKRLGDHQEHFDKKLRDSPDKDIGDVWIAIVCNLLRESIKKYTGRLNQIARRGDIQQVAWHARNLLELMIYSRFCAKNRENALRFYTDAVRDIIDVNRKHGDELSSEYHEAADSVPRLQPKRQADTTASLSSGPKLHPAGYRNESCPQDREASRSVRSEPSHLAAFAWLTAPQHRRAAARGLEASRAQQYLCDGDSLRARQGRG
jgi:hypothetical protein